MVFLRLDRGLGFGTDSLLNAVSRPPAKGRFPVSEAAEKGNTYSLTSGCQLVRDYYRAKALPAASKDDLKKDPGRLPSNPAGRVGDTEQKRSLHQAHPRAAKKRILTTTGVMWKHGPGFKQIRPLGCRKYIPAAR